MSDALLNTLLKLLDDITILKKRIYTLEHEDRNDTAYTEYLESAVSNAQFEKDLLRINITNILIDREESQHNQE